MISPFLSLIHILLEGIQDIPPSYYESAQIDGAGAIRQIFSITLLLCTPTIYFNLIVTIIAAFQVFQQPLILTNGGPLNSTYTAAIHMYNNGFLYGKMGYASMMAWSFFAVSYTHLISLICLFFSIHGTVMFPGPQICFLGCRNPSVAENRIHRRNHKIL